MLKICERIFAAKPSDSEIVSLPCVINRCASSFAAIECALFAFGSGSMLKICERMVWNSGLSPIRN
ncbi:hypothetical protein CDL15_Pgr005985 [Punica granatum]|uniref:Uncharacterized protein n=1 Tax=Punica granatum TaxID=22663 RepID=A0A218VTQ9_PUNGR|nr:hypothetical protein CDL15_Pgr005985 [Punica granatum]